LTITVGKDDITARYDDLLRDYTKTLQMPGFRKGKVPREVLMRKFGDGIREE
jgi:trigger factor